MKPKKGIGKKVVAAWKRRLPNAITWSRILFVPAVIWCLTFDTASMGFWAGVFFGLASISDWFDGYFARKYNVESMMGKFLDPVADKLLVTAALIMLIPLGRVSAILVVLILSRDILIGGLRAVAASEQIVIAAGNIGKWKTTIQMFAIPAVMLKVDYFGVPWVKVGVTGLWVSLLLSLLSGAEYIYVFFSKHRED